MEIIVLCAIYLVELACYQVGLRILFDVEQKSEKWKVMGIILPLVLGILSVEAAGKNVLISLSVLSVTFLSISGKSAEKIVKLAFTFLFLHCFDDVFADIGQKISCFGSMEFLIENIDYLLSKCGTIICLIALLRLKNRIGMKKTIHIKSHIYLLVGIIAISMMFCLATLNYTKPYLPNPRFIFLCNMLNVVIHVCIFLLVAFVIYIKNTHERMEVLLKTEQILKEAQVNYYRQLLKKEEDTRKFRHDMNNHLIYVQELLRYNKTEEAQNYLGEIEGVFKSIQKTYYVIGNEMIDAIMNYFFGMLPDSVFIEIKRKCPVEFDVKDTDICMIFSNLFQNAVEEITGNNIPKAKIEISVEKGREYVRYEMKNTIHSNLELSDDTSTYLPKTHKLDKQNHGIGLENVKMAVERNHGQFSWKQKEGYFYTTVILPIKVTI